MTQGNMPDDEQAAANADHVDDVAPYALSAAREAVERYWPALDPHTATQLARLAVGAAWPHIRAAVVRDERERVRVKLRAELAHRAASYRYADHHPDANAPLTDLRDDLEGLAGELNDPIGDGA